LNRFTPSSSKSEFIRALIIQSYEPDISVKGFSSCDDVRAVQSCLKRIANGIKELEIGDSGLGFRTIALRVSRLPGNWTVTGSRALLKRPHGELLEILKSLGCRASLSETELKILSPQDGQWSLQSALTVSGKTSSQFVSALLLNSVGLAADLNIFWEKPHKSEGYVDLTLKILKEVGHEVTAQDEAQHTAFLVRARQRLVKTKPIVLEADYSTAFTAAALGLATDGVVIENLNPNSLQPDKAGIHLLESMGVNIVWNSQNQLIVPATRNLKATSFDAARAPDLVPVFSVLASQALGANRVHNAPHLRHKESDRIFKSVQMARFLGASSVETEDGFLIDRNHFNHNENEFENAASIPYRRTRGIWSCDHDHRQAMAALVALAFGHSFEVDGLNCISKSAPELLGLAEALGIQPMNPKRVFIGQRGVGKTSLVKALGGADLDDEIAVQAKVSINTLFTSVGETAFRAKEADALATLISKGTDLIALGAGFEWTSRSLKLLKDHRKVWVRRPTDASGRIFLDRPRLDPSLSALDEFFVRGEKRAVGYATVNDQTLILPEGSESKREHESIGRSHEHTLLFGNPSFKNASITIPQISLASVESLERYLDLRQNWQLRFFEIREDLLNPQLEITTLTAICRRLIQRVGAEHVLWSRRLASPSLALQKIDEFFAKQNVTCDIDQELWATASPRTPKVISSHSDLPPRPNGDVFLKWSPTVPLTDPWSFLERGHRWWLEDIENRVFLPRTESSETYSRWTWYRVLTANLFRPLITFIREDEGSSLDQPTLLEWLFEDQPKTTDWGAVLGSPVYFSRSPQFHGPRFFAIPVQADEFPDAMRVLEFLGMKKAAITAPLKQTAHDWISGQTQGELTSRARRLGAINTIVKVGSGWSAENTDLLGFEDWIQSLGLLNTRGPVVVWGGGGTVNMVKSVFAGAVEYSARTGQPRGTIESEAFEPQIVIWAVGRNQFTGNFPPPAWRPEFILDLNYTEDSPGREYASKIQFPQNYFSGLDFFRRQAQFQTLFWKHNHVSK
jgi:3-phosphoshikimate 1-carboxyvinyltransferase